MRLCIDRKSFVISLGVVGIACGVGLWFRFASSSAKAMPQASNLATASVEPSIVPSGNASDYGKRVVAYVYDTIPITRQELGEYLIRRYGTENIEKMVGQYVIELATAQSGKSVTNAEVEADIAETLRESKMDQKQFAEIVANRYGVNFHEWKETDC